MAYANIVIKNPRPRTNLDCIAQTTVFSYDLAPFNGAEISIDSLQILVDLQGGATRMVQRVNLTKDSLGVQVSGDAVTGYNVKITLFPNFSQNVESGQTVFVRLNICDTAGNPMRTFSQRYRAVTLDYYDALSYLLKDIMELSSDYEQARMNHDGSEVNFTYKNWALTKDPRIYKNSILLDPINYSLDKINGKVRFSNPLRHGDPVDVINADYTFGVFSEEELIGFLNQAVATYNVYRPASTFRLTNLPQWGDSTAILGAAFYALQSIGLGFLNQQARVKWGEAEWKDVLGAADNVKNKYGDEFKALLEEKRFKLSGPASIIDPSYTLPGGRSRFFRYMYKEGGV